MARAGKPFIFDTSPHLRTVAMNLANMGLYQMTIADWMGIDRKTLSRQMKRDMELDQAIRSGPAVARAWSLAMLRQNCERGNQRALEYYMERILKVVPRDGLAITGDGSQVIVKVVPLNGAKPTEEEE